MIEWLLIYKSVQEFQSISEAAAKIAEKIEKVKNTSRDMKQGNMKEHQSREEVLYSFPCSSASPVPSSSLPSHTPPHLHPLSTPCFAPSLPPLSAVIERKREVEQEIRSDFTKVIGQDRDPDME